MSTQDEDPKPETPPPAWEKRDNFKINEHMADVIRKTIDVSEAELKRLRRRLEKLQYGS